MAEKKIHKGIRFPTVLIKWLERKVSSSNRTFTAEVVHQLEMRMENDKQNMKNDVK